MHFEDLSLRENLNLEENSKTLLAISGGVDSMVLWHLFEQSNHSYGIAHVNFSLREKESDQDEALVRETAQKRGIPYHPLKVDTEKYAKENKLSIQMAAREIRYNWFAELQKKEGYTHLATAHHLDDSIETFFINLNRGTGLKGIIGIHSQNGIVRPLLNASKESIRAYAEQYDILYREDKSNASIKYERNWFRHELIDLWKSHNPNLLETMNENLKRFKEAQEMVDLLLEESSAELKEQLTKGHLEIDQLKTIKFRQSVLYHLLKPYGYTENQIINLLKCIEGKQVGKVFLTKTHELQVDRARINLKKREDQLIFDGECKIEKGDFSIMKPTHLNGKELTREAFKFSASKNKEGFDANKLEYPLLLRKWHNGDWMIPLGMKGKKKISDILIDEKLSLQQKEGVFVLLSNNKIVWLLGLKVDERFKLTSETTAVLSLSTEEI